METLSKQAEQKLLDNLKIAVELVDDQGMDPTDALSKVAKAANWGPPMIRLAAYAFNTGRQTAQREAADNVLDKLASFPLADPEAVVSQLYPAEVKSASDMRLDAVSADYEQPPQWLPRISPLAKLALDYGEPKPQPYQPDPAVAARKAWGQYERLKLAKQLAETERAGVADRLLTTMQKLSGYFKMMPMDRVKFAAAELYAEANFGNAGKSLMNWVYTRAKLARVKEARVADGKLSVVSADPAVEPYSLIRTAVKQAREYHAAVAAHSAAVDELEGHRSETLRPFALGPKTANVPRSGDPWSLMPEEATTEKQADMSSMLGGAGLFSGANNLFDSALRDVPKAPSRQQAEPKVDQLVGMLDSPDQQSSMAKIQAQTILAEMMDDEVIGSHDPSDVAQAYNEIAQMAPNAAQQPLALRALLRRQLQGNIQPFEAKELTGIESGLAGLNESKPRSLLSSNMMLG